MHTYHRIIYIILSLLALLPLNVLSQWNSFIVNFKKEDLGRGTQTWQIKAHDKNHIYFANKKGLLQYNGSDWLLMPVNNKTDVRTVFVSDKDKRIYIGANDECGYFTTSANGELKYTQLEDDLIKENQLAGAYWNIFEVDNIIYFISERHILKQIDNKISAIYSEDKIDCSAMVDDVLYIGTTNGVKMLVGSTFIPIPNSEMVNGKTIRSITSFRDGFLIATAFNGLFLYEDGKVSPFITGQEDFMRRHEIFSIAVSEKFIAIGTIHRGLLLMQNGTFAPQFYNEENGLQNNTILSISFDKQEDLWLGLDDGISYITLSQSLTNLYTYPRSKGAGYVSMVKDDILFLGTNRGLFYTKWPAQANEQSNNIHFAESLSGQVWGLENYNGDFFCLHDKGLYLLKKEGDVELIPDTRGVTSLTPHETDPSKCWVSTYSGLLLLEKKNGRWNIFRELEGVKNWPKNLAFSSPDTLWLSRFNTGVDRFIIDTTDYSVKDVSFYDKSKGFESTKDMLTYKVNGKVFFLSQTGFYEYDSINDIMIPNKEFNRNLNKNSFMLTEKDNRLYNLTQNAIQIADISEDNMLTSVKTYSLAQSQISLIQSHEALNIINDSTVIIPNENGFALLNTQIDMAYEKHDLFIKSVYAPYPKDSLLYTNNYLNRKVYPSIDYENNALRIEYDIRSFGQNSTVEFRYKLSPSQEWSEYTSSTVKEYSNLREGDYHFIVEAKHENGEVSSTEFSFTILPPWYRTTYAYIIYVFLAILFIPLLYHIEERRITKRKKKELAEKEQEMQIKEQEFVKESMQKEQLIIELRNEKLEQEVMHKSQEIANLMINVSRKNEVLADIKKDLQKITAEMKENSTVNARRMLLSLNNRVSTNMQSDDILKRFEEQFDLVHNNFISHLRNHHPDLGVNEIKMCAYLRMNLTSKEIAPLLNLSIRGVETLRYRLRKKLGLEREDGIIDYIERLS